ncbi:Tetraspanin-6 [Acorus calamus]|uniref:Tetraspanin-6 n=1 Tax=Acorus calamus TaxID=4465 RepID=A0AAV9C4Y2_ACOCL|nr:Tetraspanin-6 [Acorus calamus]
MYRFSNTVIGYLNLLTMLASIPIIGGALWVAKSSAKCEGFLQMPLLIVGFVVLLVSLMGFVGACFNIAWALWVYLVVVIFLIVTILCLTIFGFIVTSKGGGVEVPSRLYREYRLEDYSPWLRNKVKGVDEWRSIRACLLGAGVLEEVRRDFHKLSVLNVIVIVFLVCIYSIGCCAFRNTRLSVSDYPYGENHMSKARPRWDFFWYDF